MFSYAPIRAITGAAVMPGRNSAGAEIDLGCDGGTEAVVAGQSGRRAGPGAGSAIFPDSVKT
jgi:hypothetical protein